MSYDVKLTEQNNYLQVEISGQRVRGKEVYNAGLIWTQVADVCKEKGYTRILVIFKLTGPLQILDGYEIAKSPEKYGWDRLWKLAIVDLYDKSRETNLFGETVAGNRGYRSVKVFDNEEKAKIWLL